MSDRGKIMVVWNIFLFWVVLVGGLQWNSEEVYYATLCGNGAILEDKSSSDMCLAITSNGWNRDS